MRALVWIAEGSWEACVRRADELLPSAASVTLLHVAPTDVEALAAGGRAGWLGRRRPHPSTDELREISDQEAQALLATAQAALGRPCQTVSRRGRVEREVVAACADADLLLLARDGDRRLGPRSLGPRARFVVDHAPCSVVLVWAVAPPGVETIPPPPRRENPPPGEPPPPEPMN